jgi:DNA-binding MarR family transcriptional regulator
MKSMAAVGEIRRFNRYYTNLIGVLDRHILRSPYSLTEVRIMYEIEHNRVESARKLKGILSVDEGYLSRAIESLVKRGLLLRKQSVTDRRVFHLSLSSKGKREFLRLNEAAESEIEAIVGHLSKREVEEVVSAMKSIEALLGGKGQRS